MDLLEHLTDGQFETFQIIAESDRASAERYLKSCLGMKLEHVVSGKRDYRICANEKCGKPFERPLNMSKNQFAKRKYCSISCSRTCPKANAARWAKRKGVKHD